MYFFFNDTATTEIYTLSLHDALPIYNLKQKSNDQIEFSLGWGQTGVIGRVGLKLNNFSMANLFNKNKEHRGIRSEEHTSELQSRQYLVCRLLLEKKKQTISRSTHVNI